MCIYLNTKFIEKTCPTNLLYIVYEYVFLVAQNRKQNQKCKSILSASKEIHIVVLNDIINLISNSIISLLYKKDYTNTI